MEQKITENKEDVKKNLTTFDKVFDYYKQREYTFLQIKMTDGNVFNVAIKDLVYWTYSAFFCYFRKNRLNKYEIDDSSNVFKYSYPCPNYSLEETKNLLLSRNASLGLSANEMFNIIMSYLHINKQIQLYGKVKKTNVIQVGEFVTFNQVFTKIDVETTDYTIMFNPKNIVYDMMINPNEIVSIMPLKYEFELLEIKDTDVLKLIEEFEKANNLKEV